MPTGHSAPNLRLSGATVIDGRGGDPVQSEVQLAGGLVERVGDLGRLEAGDAAVNLDGLTLLPGLIDAHTHLGIVENFHDERAVWGLVAAQIFENCRLALEAGFTTVRDVGGLDGGVARAVASGLVRGPRILPSGPIISEAGGNGDLISCFSCCGRRVDQGLPGLSTIGAGCCGPEEVRAAARMALRRGATQLKVSVNTLTALGRSRAPETEFTRLEIAAAVWEAQAKGTYVTAHATNPAGVRLAVEAGIGCLEHGGIADEETATLVAAAGIPLVPTLTQASLYAAEPDGQHGSAEHFAAFGAEMEASLLLAKAHGIAVGLGTDLEGAAQQHRGRELRRRAQLTSAMEAICAATRVNAAIVRRPELGVIAPGAVADLIAVSGDPLSEPALLADPDRVVFVIQGGMVVKGRAGTQ